MRFFHFAQVTCLILGVVARSGSGAVEDRPTVTDKALEISVVLQCDDRTLVAKDQAGETLWKVDVIAKAGEPAVGQPVVRHLSLKDGKVTAVYGKHTFADFDLKTGKLVSVGSD